MGNPVLRHCPLDWVFDASASTCARCARSPSALLAGQKAAWHQPPRMSESRTGTINLETLIRLRNSCKLSFCLQHFRRAHRLQMAATQYQCTDIHALCTAPDSTRQLMVHTAQSGPRPGSCPLPKPEIKEDETPPCRTANTAK